MKRNLLRLLPGLALVAGLVFLNACGSDDPPPAPTASFTYAASGREVTFTNTSTNATTYAWDFGDGETSTEQNPKHTYPKYGKFTAKLSVTGEGGTANSLPDELTLAKTSAVAIDGAFSEWANIPDAIVSVDAASGTVKKVKVDYDASKIYFYVEGTGDLRGFFDIYLDTDNNPETGYTSGWYPLGFGADWFTEGYFAVDHSAPFWTRQDGFENTDWAGWGAEPAIAMDETIAKASDIGTAGSGKAIEIAISRSALTGLSAAGFSFAVVDVSEGWATLGSLPENNSGGAFPEAKMAFFDLTK